MASKPPAQELRIVLVGKTGTGKSASGNTILGNQSFTVKMSPSSGAEKCSTTRVLHGQTLSVVDTPGLFHTSLDKEKIKSEIVRFIEPLIETLLGPHVFLWVVKLGTFTNEDKKSMEIFKTIFPSEAKFTIVLFTYGHKGKVESFIDRIKTLKEFVQWSNDQYHVFDNSLKGNDGQGQVEDLVKKINKIEQNKTLDHPDLIKQAYEALEAFKNQAEEQPAGGSKEETTSLEKLVEKSLTFVTDQCPLVKTFLEKLCDLAEAIIELP